VLVYPSALDVSTRTVTLLSDALRARRRGIGTRWRVLSSGRQALLVLAYLRKGQGKPRMRRRILNVVSSREFT